jgi:hypothetical protein
MKLTQAITNWLHKMFAWRPWKQSTQIEYSPYDKSINKGTNQEAVSKSINEVIMPQTGISPRLSTIQELPERVVQTDVTAKKESPETPADETPAGMQTSPSTQQRLEFLQYLIKRGIVNEGLEEDM